jgi:glycosyltransferase involved in cell wall biosynthesis
MVGEASSLLNQGKLDVLARRVARRAAVEARRLSGRAFTNSPPARGRPAPVTFGVERVVLDAFLAAPRRISIEAPPVPKLAIVAVIRDGAPWVLDCLRSLREEHSEFPFELVLVDDASTEDARAVLEHVAGAAVVRNAQEAGVIRALEQGSEASVGEYLLLLGGPFALAPGAIEAALRAISESSIGAVAGRIVNRDGSVHEAGGIIWSDGTCEPYGAGLDAQAYEVMFQRDVDYGSAFLLVRRSTLVEIGTLDPEYGQIRYAFADLCARLHERDLRVVYEPRCVAFRPGTTEPGPSLDTDTERDRGRFASRHERYVGTRKQRNVASVIEARTATRKALRLLFIDDRIPHPHLGQGYPRSWEMLRIFSEGDHDVTFVPATIPEESWPSVYSLVPRHVEVALGVHRDRIETLLAQRVGYYDVIIASRVHNMRPLDALMQRRPEWFEGVHVIYDAEALFCLRAKLFDELFNEPWPPDRVEREVEAEVRFTRSADIVFSVSDIDKKEFERYGAKDVRLLVHMTSVSPTVTPFAGRRDILFVGSMSFHPSPNSDSIVWFVNEVFPLIRAALGDVRLFVAGTNKVDAVAALASDSVQVLGVVPDLTSLFETSRIFIAPTRFSGGVPLKIIEAAGWGIPCVTSALIAAQIGWKNGQELLSAPVSDAAGFAAQCVELYTNEPLWNHVRSRALARVSESFSEAAFRAILDSALAPGPRSR